MINISWSTLPVLNLLGLFWTLLLIRSSCMNWKEVFARVNWIRCTTYPLAYTKRMHYSRMRTTCLCIVWGEGEGRCCHLVPGGGRCCHLVPVGEVLSRGLWSCTPPPPTPPPPRWIDWMTHACKNITFVPFATWAVIIWGEMSYNSYSFTADGLG